MNFSEFSDPIRSKSTELGKISHNPLFTSKARAKIAQVESACHRILRGEEFRVPLRPGRDLEVVAIKDLPAKKGIGSLEGQSRLMHDLASIELQAMELAFRTLCEYPEAPQAFKEQLAHIAIEESEHLQDCLEVLDILGKPWGTYPVHLALWQSVHQDDSLLDRILIVHRYLEGSGLDAGETLLRRLRGMGEGPILKVVERIHREEIAHVQFGSLWYREICKNQKLNPQDDFSQRLNSLFRRIPRRLEPIQTELRKQAEFTDSEIEALQQLRNRWLNANQEARIHV